jgi:hypothetical protein
VSIRVTVAVEFVSMTTTRCRVATISDLRCSSASSPAYFKGVKSAQNLVDC